MRSLVVLFALGACYAPSVKDGVPCSSEGTCPSGQTCVNQTCQSGAVGAIDAPELLDSTPIEADAQLHDAAVDSAIPIDGSGGMVTPNALSGQRWLLPCTGAHTGTLCPCATATQAVNLHGPGGTIYNVTFRIRGVMEYGPYTGGAAGTGTFYTGGMINDAFHNIYELTVSAPSQHYFINSGTGVTSTDFTATIPISANATVTFSASGQDNVEGVSDDGTGHQITIPGVTTTPMPYDGQFAQLDVISFN